MLKKANNLCDKTRIDKGSQAFLSHLMKKID